MKRIIDFNEEGLVGLHFFVEHLDFPIVAASYSDWEKQQLSYMEQYSQSEIYTSESLCRWCINHNIQYRIVYPLCIKSIFRNPYRYIIY